MSTLKIASLVSDPPTLSEGDLSRIQQESQRLHDAFETRTRGMEFCYDGRMSGTHTYAIVEVSPATYDEIRAKLEAAGYAHAIHHGADGEVIDMHGLALTVPRCPTYGPPGARAGAKPDEDQARLSPK